MKIAIISKSCWNIYNFRKLLILKLIKKGSEVIVFSKGDNCTEKLINMGCKFIEINFKNRNLNPIYDFFNFISIYRNLKKNNINFILSFNIKPIILSGLASQILKIKNISMITGLGTAFEKKNIIQKISLFLYKVSLKNIYLVLFQNHDDFNYFRINKIISEKNYNFTPGSGVDVNYFHYSDYTIKKNYTFLLLTRLLWSKGIKEYCEAAEIIKKKYIKTEFLLVGPFEKKDSNEVSINFINKYINQNFIKYINFIDDVKTVIIKSDCAVLPSYREGTPKFLLEAISMGKPIITTNSPGCKEVVEEDKNGFLCKIKNSKDLADKIEKFILLDVDKKIEMSRYSREIAINKFDENFVVNIYLNHLGIDNL